MHIQCSLANANSVEAKFRITRILTRSPRIAPIKTCTIKVLLSRISLNKKFCLTSTSLVEPFALRRYLPIKGAELSIFTYWSNDGKAKGYWDQ